MTVVQRSVARSVPLDGSRGLSTQEMAKASDTSLELLLIRPSDALEKRLGVLVSLRPGWDGVGSVAPSRAAVNTLYRAAEHLARGRALIGASPHADGYINVEWEKSGIWYTALLWHDRMDLMIDDEVNDNFQSRTVPLDAGALTDFLRFSE